ncbi:MAG: hypothetical protein LQ343_003954 [Gyalolechia ehrenbergii]|nr:MAG: hypothetical protein LQ343_003954 [Gyalolechia ehrenbergii]
MSSAPLPTRLVLLNDLPTLPAGEKVRFLGCVTGYNISTGTLTLNHAYPSSSATDYPIVNVDVNLLLSTLSSTDTQIGEWVNVMGYVQDFEDGGKRGSRGSAGKGKGNEGRIVGVQAVMLWSAGSVRLGDYEKAVGMRKGIEMGKG